MIFISGYFTKASHEYIMFSLSYITKMSDFVIPTYHRMDK